jgi:hypothetical protein
MESSMPSKSSTEAGAETTEACATIEHLAAKLGIRLRFIGDAGPEYDTPDALLVQFDDPGDSGLMALHDVTALGPYKFDAHWDWTGPSQHIWNDHVARRQYQAAGSPTRYRRAIPVADLNTLVVCLDAALLRATGALPAGWTIETSRTLGSATATAMHAAPATGCSVTTTIRRRALTRAGARAKAAAWVWETEMARHWDAVEEAGISL